MKAVSCVLLLLHAQCQSSVANGAAVAIQLCSWSLKQVVCNLILRCLPFTCISRIQASLITSIPILYLRPPVSLALRNVYHFAWKRLAWLHWTKWLLRFAFVIRCRRVDNDDTVCRLHIIIIVIIIKFICRPNWRRDAQEGIPGLNWTHGGRVTGDLGACGKPPPVVRRAYRDFPSLRLTSYRQSFGPQSTSKQPFQSRRRLSHYYYY